jgi:hypothetical protein
MAFLRALFLREPHVFLAESSCHGLRFPIAGHRGGAKINVAKTTAPKTQ